MTTVKLDPEMYHRIAMALYQRANAASAAEGRAQHGERRTAKAKLHATAHAEYMAFVKGEVRS
jgi:hypothetical protein